MSDSPDHSRFYITTPIYYVNDSPHIGHTYTTVAVDCIARYQRLLGRDVVFLTGTDEHGAKVARSAAARNVTPQQHVDENSRAYQDLWKVMHISEHAFIRTTDSYHVRTVQDVWRALVASDDIYRSEYEGWYCVPDETYLREADLKDGKCPDCGRPVEQVTQPAYFFRTSKYADRLAAYIQQHPEFIQPESRRNEVLSLIGQGLRDACVSRAKAEWDIPAPDDESQSVYVWFDALINYLSYQRHTGLDIWPPDVQLMGKDILPRFHATLWPSILFALDLPLPKTIFAHGWWMSDSGDKISKSRGNKIELPHVAHKLAEVSGADFDIAIDAVRYFLFREVSFGLDGAFSFDALLGRFNADLANDLGNLLNRTLPLIQRYFDGEVPQPGPGAGELREAIDTARSAVEAAMAEFEFRRALEAIWELISAGNHFIDKREPWALFKAGKSVELGTVLYDVLDCVRVVAIAISPFMPEVAAEIRRQMGLGDLPVTWDDVCAGEFPEGRRIGEPKPMFPRVDLARLKAKLKAEEQKTATAESPKKAPTATADTITYDDFQKVQLKSGRVLSAEPVEGANKLLKLSVDVGEERPRQIVAGIAEVFKPEDLVGRNVVVVANLAPATIRGVESQGMLLAAGEKTPEALVTFDRDCSPGTKVR
jgi:methionyl-tRNA synthetase